MFPPVFVLAGLLSLLLLERATAAGGRVRFVDPAARGDQTGSSWGDAWTSLDAIGGLEPGDTVYLSGGPAGGEQIYRLSGGWSSLRGGSPGRPIRYLIGPDSLHDGTVIFQSDRPHSTWIEQVSNLVVSGDGGDGRAHFQLAGFGAMALCNGGTDLRFSYISGQNLDRVGDFNPVRRLEIDHCSFRITDPGADHASYAQIRGTGWDDSSFHDNTLLIPNGGNGAGADGLQWVGTGFSIYRNRVIGYVTGYTGGQHQDGWQDTGGSAYIKVCQNYFRDIANYPIFADAYFGGFAHVRIEGNTLVLSRRDLQQSDPPQGIAAGPDGGAFRQLGHWPEFTDVLICNNLVVDYGRHAAISLHNNDGQHSRFLHCVVADNLTVNSGPWNAEPGVSASGNQRVTAQDALALFRRYRPLDPENDFHWAGSGSDQNQEKRSGTWIMSPGAR